MTAGRAGGTKVASARCPLAVGWVSLPCPCSFGPIGYAVPASVAAIARRSAVLAWQPFGFGAATGRRLLHVRAGARLVAAKQSEGYSLQAATLLDSQQSKGEVNPLSISPPSHCLPDQYNAT